MESRGRIPMVFAQSTDRNERISSLLSAVFLRTVRSDYTEAAAHSFPSSIERLEYNNNKNNNNNHRTELVAPMSEEYTSSQVPVVLFIQQEEQRGSIQDNNRNDTLELLLSIKRAVGRTAVACAELTATGSYADNVRSLRGFFKLLHPQTPLFVIESSVSTQWVQEVVVGVESQMKTLNMLGMVTLCSRQQNLPWILTNPRSKCPTLLLAVPERGDDDDMHNDLWKACRSNPDIIAVSLPLKISGFAVITTQPGESLLHCEATRLWAARTVVKFIQAVSVTACDDDSNSNTTEGYSIERRPSDLSWKLRASRL